LPGRDAAQIEAVAVIPEYEQWKNTPIKETERAYLGGRDLCGSGLGKEKAALLVEYSRVEQEIFDPWSTDIARARGPQLLVPG
jgi:hypothetical protein